MSIPPAVVRSRTFSTSRLRRVTAALTLLLATAVALPTPSAWGATSAAAGPITLTPTIQPLSNPEIPNSLRGQYSWMGYATQPAAWPATDVYYRDQVYWGRIERTRGTYSFSSFDTLLTAAGNLKGKAGFRVMAYCPGCWMDARTDKDAWPAVVPAWMPVQPGLSRRVPDWNNETFLSSWEALMAELGRRYNSDPRLGYVDVGGYGKYGEWWVDNTEGTPITDANRKRMVTAVVRAFPSKWVLINTMTDTTFTRWVLDSFSNTGMRTDSLGAPNMYSTIPISPELQNYWKTRPIFTEWATTGDPVAGKAQVPQWHISTTSSQNMRLTYVNMTTTQQAAYTDAVKRSGYRYGVSSVTVPPLTRGTSATLSMTLRNEGSAPTYAPWQMTLQLRGSLGVTRASQPVNIDLRTLLPGTSTQNVTMNIPGSVSPGLYNLILMTTDPTGYLAPMRFTNANRTPDGGVLIGTVSVS